MAKTRYYYTTQVELRVKDLTVVRFSGFLRRYYLVLMAAKSLLVSAELGSGSLLSAVVFEPGLNGPARRAFMRGFQIMYRYRTQRRVSTNREPTTTPAITNGVHSNVDASPSRSTSF